MNVSLVLKDYLGVAISFGDENGIHKVDVK